MLNALILFLMLLVTWLLLSGFFTPFFIILGVVSCAITVFVSIRMYAGFPKINGLLIKIIKMPIYLIWLIKEIVVSSISVSLKVWQVKPDISPKTAWVSNRQIDDLGMAALANSITLTPGTVAISVRKGLVQVHALEEKSIDELRQGGMDSKVGWYINGWRD
ncbi:Na+/H+ antiporter subunit E [Rickettsiales bacterium]|nr:Na+/H+ antiporter subunit E [Rickettsiales bacterium]